MEMHARRVQIAVQLLAPWLHFIIASVSALTVIAVQIQMMVVWTKGGLCIQLYLHIIELGKGMRFSSSVNHLHNMHLSAPPPQIQIRTTNAADQYARWTIDGCSKKGRFKHTLHCDTLHAYLRSAYVCAWIILSNIRWWARLWSRAVFHRWSTMSWMAHGGNFPRPSKCPFPRTSKWAMSKVERPLNWNIRKFFFRSDIYQK